MATGIVSEEFCPPEALPKYDRLITEDEKPVDNIYAAWQHLLLLKPLTDTWKGPGAGCPRFVATNIGLFYADKNPAFSPDLLIALNVSPPDTEVAFEKENRSYFVWRYEKAPEALVEVVSNKIGGELTTKLEAYAQMGVDYYIVWDPQRYLGEKQLYCFARHLRRFVPCEPWFPDLELGLKLWEGCYDGMRGSFLRWCDQKGNIIPTGAERAEQESQRAEQEKQRAEQEKQRAERLAAKLRELGVDVDGN